MFNVSSELHLHVHEICSLYNSVTGSICEFVPAVCCADFDGCGSDALESGLDGADFIGELLAGEVAAVESLGADGYGVDGVCVFGSNGRDGSKIGVVGFLDIGPISSLH